MIIGGVQKNSMIDYPGKICCVLFLSGCNFKCPYCHNPQLVKCAPCESCISEAGIYDFLKERRSFLDGVVISGGEPTLHEDLPDLCRRLKHLGYPVKLDTNGSRPHALEFLIQQNLVDYIAMDIKTDPEHYGSLIKSNASTEDVFNSVGIIMESGLPYEFKTTCMRSLVDARAVDGIARTISGAKLYALQKLRTETVLDPEQFTVPEQRYHENDLLYFKSIADPWVESCIVR